MVSQPVLDKINAAEDALGAAKKADADHDLAIAALNDAALNEHNKGVDAAAAHSAANGLALDAIAALKAELGIA